MIVDFQRLQKEVSDCHALLLSLQARLDKQPAPQSTTEELPVSTAEAARQFGIAKQTLYQNAKKIKHTKRFGRLYFYPSDLRAYLAGGKEVGND